MGNQEKRLLEYLKINKRITPLEAWAELGIYRLSAIMFKLREKCEIQTSRKSVTNKFGEHCNFAVYELIDY
jgi:hypothetical protein